MDQPQKSKVTSSLDSDQLIALMDVYLSEWMHRDDLLWTQVFKYFYANLIVIVLPNIAEFIGIVLPPMNKKIFPIIGIIMAILFLYVELGYVKRLTASSRSYEKIMEMLENKDYKRVPVKELPYGWLFNSRMSEVLVVAMFFSLLAIAIVLLYYDKTFYTLIYNLKNLQHYISLKELIL